MCSKRDYHDSIGQGVLSLFKKEMEDHVDERLVVVSFCDSFNTL